MAVSEASCSRKQLPIEHWTASFGSVCFLTSCCFLNRNPRTDEHVRTFAGVGASADFPNDLVVGVNNG